MRFPSQRFNSGIRFYTLIAFAILIIVFVGSVNFAPSPAAAQSPDDDVDGASNIQEQIDGTDLQDPDSYIEHSRGTYCLDWNGFLADWMQVIELRNAGCSSLALEIQLRDSDGAVQHTFNTVLAQSRQLDVVANTLPGFEPNRYGSVCATITSGAPDALDAQLSVYQLNSDSFDFAYATVYAPGRTGKQSISYNHFFPTLATAQLHNFVSSFVQLTSEESSAEGGELVFFDQQGTEVQRLAVTVAARGRRDVATHGIGANTIGTIEWQPSNPAAKFRLVLNRYYLNGASVANAEIAAVAITPQRASGSMLATPFSTQSKLTVLEMSNALTTAIVVPVTIYDQTGAQTSHQSAPIIIPAKGSRHLVLNDFLANGVGNVQFQASQAQSVVASLMEYGLNSTGGLTSAAFATPKAGLGIFQKTSYNNFLGGCRLRLANLTSSIHSLDVTMTRFDGTMLPIGNRVMVPANGVTEVNICGNETQPAYGEVLLTPTDPETITGHLVRSNRTNGEFFVPLSERSSCMLATLAVSGSPLQLTANGSSGSLTITNTSSESPAVNLASSFAGTALAGMVTESGNTCAFVAPGASCTLTFMPGANAVAQTTFPITGNNAVAGNAAIEILPIPTTTLSVSISTLALASLGTPRNITVTNIGTQTARDVSFSPGGLQPSLLTIFFHNICGDILPGANCTMVVIPGLPTAAPGVTNPAPFILTASGANTNTVTTSMYILTYGSVYQSGYLFSIDDTTDDDVSIGGTVAALTDQAAPGLPNGVIWSSDGSGAAIANTVFDTIPGINENSSSPVDACDGNTDGRCNSQVILDYYSLPQTNPAINLNFYAAGRCAGVISGYSDWYLPSICETGFDSLFEGSGCASQASPLLQDMQSNLVDNGNTGNLSGIYWTSTQYSASPASTAWLANFSPGNGFQTTLNKGGAIGVRCVRRLDQ